MTDKKDLKIQALREGFRERYAAQADDYENRIADWRIALHEMTERAEGLQKELNQTLSQLQMHLEGENNVQEVVTSEVVSSS